MKWMELSWPDLREIDRDGTLVVAPFGSIEQHSRHLPVSTDSMIVGEIADRLDAQFGEKVLTLPVQWLGLSRHHLEFGGTLSADLDTHAEMVCDIGDSVLGDGFSKLLLLNGHGGNAPTLEVASQEMAIDFPDAIIAWASYWDVAAKQIDAIRDSEPGGIGHAGEMETSMVLAIQPDQVHKDRYKKDGRAPNTEFLWTDITRGGSVHTYEPFSKLTHHGGFGDPTLASAEKGEKFLKAVVEQMALVITDILEGRFTRQ